MFHHNWVKTTGHVLDSRIRTMYRISEEVGGGSIPLHSYIVEFRAPNGQTTKLEVEQKIGTVAVGAGTKVPLLVSPDGTRAIFDTKDPRINVNAVNKAHDDADKQRFRQKLDERRDDGQKAEKPAEKMRDRVGGASASSPAGRDAQVHTDSATIHANSEAAQARRAQRIAQSKVDRAQAATGRGGEEQKLSQLERLARLHADGALTDAEFTAEKTKLLSS